MPFCTSCGKEGSPGKKFCEYCGTPFEQPAVSPATPPIISPAPASFQAAMVPASRGSAKIIIIAGIVGILIIIAGVYFIGLPLLRNSPGTGSTIPQATALPTLPQTPFQPEPSMEITPAPVMATTPSGSQTYEEKYMETYTQVYSINRAFVGGQKEIFTQILNTPPLYIKFNITPKYYYGEKTVDIGLHSERIVNTSYPSPNAWFLVKVYDAGNGELAEEQGFNKQHGVTTKQEFMIRAPGNYRVEMSGNEVIAEVRILTGKS